MKKHVVVQLYDKTWSDDFVAIRDELNTVLKDLTLRIEHVGSTSVEGLSAKPIIDIDVVIQDQTTIVGLKYVARRPVHTRPINALSITSVALKSEITPSRRGLMASTMPGVRPSIREADSPTARTLPVLLLTATTEGSLRTIPLPLI